MKLLLRPFEFIYYTYAFITFVLIMLLSLPFVLVGSPFGIKGGNFIYKICSLWARIWYLLIGIRHKEIFESPHDKSRQYIFVANHNSYMDIPPIVASIKQPVRVLGKYEIVKIPIFGWIYKTTVILVDRRNADKRSRSVRALKAAINHGISIFIFPEGTFNETGNPLKDFFDGAFRIAIETQTPIKPILFVDTIERMHYNSFFSLTPGSSRVVFLEEVDVSKYNMKQIQQLKKHVYDLMEAGLKRYRSFPSVKD